MTVIRLEQIGSGNLRDQIYRQIRNTIQRGAFAPGKKLVDVNIAAELGVSRMPVRDALMQLMHEGYLVGTTRGFTLPTLTVDDIVNIFEIRRLLEPRAAAHAANRLGENDLAKVKAALTDARMATENGDAELLFQASSEFRNGWLAAVDNVWLSKTIARFVDHVLVVRLMTLPNPSTQTVVLNGMEGIYDAFSRHDAMAAFDRMTRFIQNAEDNYVALSALNEARLQYPQDTTKRA